MEKKSLMIGTIAGMFMGSMLAGTIVFAASTSVQAQKKIVSYDGVEGTGLVYNGTTYAELYAVQQALKKQGIVNHWNGAKFTLDSPTQSTKELATQNQQLSSQVGDLSSIFKNLQKLSPAQQQQVVNQLLQAAGSANSNSELDHAAKGLDKAVKETQTNPGAANTVLQNLVNGDQPDGSAKQGSSTDTSHSTNGTSPDTNSNSTANASPDKSNNASPDKHSGDKTSNTSVSSGSNATGSQSSDSNSTDTNSAPSGTQNSTGDSNSAPSNTSKDN